MLINHKRQDINPLIFGRETCKPLHSYGPESRSYWLLHYVVSGQGSYTVNGQSYHVMPSECFIVHPYDLIFYQADEQDPWEYIWVGFETGLALPKAFEQYVMSLPEGETIFTDMNETFRLTSGREMFLTAKLWELFSLLTERETQTVNRSMTYIEQAKNCIESEYMHGITVTELARRLNLDRSYFSALFKQATGKPPQQYINDYRLQKAALLLTLYDYTPSMAALSTGFPDIFSFSRVFKKHFRMPPTEYKRRYTAQNAQS